MAGKDTRTLLDSLAAHTARPVVSPTTTPAAPAPPPAAPNTRYGLTCDVTVLAKPAGADRVRRVTIRLATADDLAAVAWLNTQAWREAAQIDAADATTADRAARGNTAEAANHADTVTEATVSNDCPELAYDAARTAELLGDTLPIDKDRQYGIDLYEHGGRLVVADAGGDIVGFTWCGPARDTAPARLVEVYAMNVAKEYRGSGVAAAVLGMGLEGHPAYLWVGRENSRGQAFYEKHGFNTDDDSPAKRDLLCMFR